MIFKVSAEFKSFLFGLLLLLASDIFASEKEVECRPEVMEKVGQYQHYILSGDVEDLSESINYPVKASIGGRKTNISSELVLKSKAVWNSIFTERLVDLVNSSDVCSLAKELDLDPVSHKIRSLVIFYDEEDARYSYSGISSEKALLDFLNAVLEAVSDKDYQRLSGFFKYPFVIRCGDNKITISDQQDFNEYADNIIDDDFIAVIKRSLGEDGFVQNPKGLMLNKRGDIWVLEVYGNLLLQPVNL